MPIQVEYESGLRERYHDTLLGSGGKGQVFTSLDGRNVFKLFQPEASLTEYQHRSALRQIVDRYSFIRQHPYWSELFSWPDQVASRRDGRPCLGVRMEKVDLPALHKTIEFAHVTKWYDLLKPDERGWWIARVAIAMKVARAIAYLESNLLVHTDISPKNVLANPFTGHMTLIDCDGIVSPGTQLLAQVAGTPEYQAPELVSGAVRAPDRYTDRHALAVLIYRLLYFLHPLKGSRRHPQADRVSAEEEDRYLWGDGALFIDDPHDQSNRPAQGIIPEVIPAKTLDKNVADLVDRAFVAGLHHPGARPLAHEWESALTRVFDRIVPCSNPQCLQRFFVAPIRPGALRCPMCRQSLRGPASIPYLRLWRHDVNQSGVAWEDDANYVVVGWPGRALHAWHLSSDVTPVPVDGRPYDPRPVARFEYNPETDVWFLVNEGMDQIAVQRTLTVFPRGGRVALDDGIELLLGATMRSRRATVRLVPMVDDPSIFALPRIDVTAPWPSLAPSSEAIAWRPGQRVALPLYRGVR